MNEATTDTVILAAIEQFEDQTTRVLIAAMEEYEDLGTTQKEDKKTQPKCYHSNAALEEYEDLGTTQKEDKKTPAKMLPLTHCMCTICIFVVNARIVK